MSLRKVLMILAVSPSFAMAATWADMWQTKDQQGQSSFDNKDYSQAAQKFEDSNWKGSAHYRAGDYKNAYEEFKKDDSATGLYNQGNALTQMGNYKEAIEAYKKAIEKRYDFEDAKANLEIAEELDKQKEQNQNSNGDGDKNNQDKQDKKDSQSDKSDKDNDKADSKDKDKSDKSENQTDDKNDDKQDKSDNNDNQQNQKPQDDKDDNQENADNNQQNKSNQQDTQNAPEQTEEQKAAERQAKLDKRQAENMLARINDDPGGLLKQKFARDYQRRIGGNQ